MENLIKIKLAVDRSRNRVLFADAGSDFADILLSFLTLPLSAVQFCMGASSPGCLSSLCDSVRHLKDSDLLDVDACHGMLLWPQHGCEFEICHCRLCTYYFFVKEQPSLQPRIHTCSCWHVLGRLVHIYYGNHAPRYKQTFLEGKERFVISDDWVIKPASTSTTLSLLQSSGHGWMDEHSFEEVEVSVSWAQVLCMMKASISSKTIFSDVFLSEESDAVTCVNLNPRIRQEYPHPCNKESDFDPLPHLNVKLFFDKHEMKVMYAECKHEFVDLLFTSLTYPLYCLTKSTGCSSYLGRSFSNLYNSAVDLHGADFLTGCQFTSKELRLAPLRNWSNTSPIFANNMLSEKRQFVKDRVYLVEDGLRIYQASAALVMKHWCNKDKDDVVEMNVTMNREEAVALMRAVVTSKTALTDVFKGRMEDFLSEEEQMQ